MWPPPTKPQKIRQAASDLLSFSFLVSPPATEHQMQLLILSHYYIFLFTYIYSLGLCFPTISMSVSLYYWASHRHPSDIWSYLPFTNIINILSFFNHQIFLLYRVKPRLYKLSLFSLHMTISWHIFPPSFSFIEKQQNKTLKTYLYSDLSYHIPSWTQLNFQTQLSRKIDPFIAAIYFKCMESFS